MSHQVNETHSTPVSHDYELHEFDNQIYAPAPIHNPATEGLAPEELKKNNTAQAKSARGKFGAFLQRSQFVQKNQARFSALKSRFKKPVQSQDDHDEEVSRHGSSVSTDSLVGRPLQPLSLGDDNARYDTDLKRKALLSTTENVNRIADTLGTMFTDTAKTWAHAVDKMSDVVRAFTRS